MGNIFATLFKGLWDPTKQARILMLGFDDVGKTTILYRLKVGEVVTANPSLGFIVATVEYKNISFTVWTFGATNRIRSVWKHFFEGTQHLVFVVDSSDRERIDEAREEFMKLLVADELQNVSVLVLANKQDLPNAMSADEIVKKLGLDSFPDRKWHIQPTCAVSGDGLYEGLD